MNSRENRNAFTLVEVVLAIGIFAIAIVAIMGLFGSSMRGVKSLSDRDALSGVVGSVSGRLSEFSRADLAAISAGSTGGNRPVLYCYSSGSDSPATANSDAGPLLWTNSPPTGPDAGIGRVFRVTLYRAMDPESVEYNFTSTNVAFPVRVVVDVLAPGQTAGTPELTWSFHKTLMPDQ